MALIAKVLGWNGITPTVEGNSWLTLSSWFAGYSETAAGVSVGPDTALKIGTVYACVGLLSETIASLPLVIYRYLEDQEGRQRAKNHPLYEVLHSQPNETQTAFEFTQMMMTHALLRGSGYARIMPGPRGFADRLVPYHPERVTKERLESGRVRYKVENDLGKSETLNQEDIFEVGGLSLDGWNTVSVVSYAKDSFGLSLAAEKYGSKFFRNDSRPGGVLETDGKISRDAAKRIKSEWEALHAGGNQHRVAVLEQGLKWQAIGVTPEEAQFLGTREHQAEDVCRWFRVPPHMVGLTSKTTSWGTGIEQQAIGFLTYTLRPWLTRWSQSIRRDLILAPNTYFADFVVEALLRGDIETRYNAYATARQWGWLNVNEIRQKENLNPVNGGDTYLHPLNMERGARAENGHYRLLVEESAGRLVRKETAAMGRLAKADNWAEYVEGFYSTHINLVSQAMRISIKKATIYCEHGREAMLEHGRHSALSEDWESRRVMELADLAMEADNE